MSKIDKLYSSITLLYFLQLKYVFRKLTKFKLIKNRTWYLGLINLQFS